MTTASQMAELIGRTAAYVVPTAFEITVNVRITDVRTVYGREQVLITPLDGSGEAWVLRSSVTLRDGAR